MQRAAAFQESRIHHHGSVALFYVLDDSTGRRVAFSLDYETVSVLVTSAVVVVVVVGDDMMMMIPAAFLNPLENYCRRESRWQ